MRTTGSSRREGVTLIEMMIAIVLFVLVFGLAVPFFRYQARSVSASAGRLDALQNARYAQNAIDRDMRIAGIGIVDQQPLIVQADGFAVTFNADLATKDQNDPSSIYYDRRHRFEWHDQHGQDATRSRCRARAVQYPDVELHGQLGPETAPRRSRTGS